MRFRAFFLLVSILVFGGCTTVHDLERVQRGEGRCITYNVGQITMTEISQIALRNAGLVIQSVKSGKEKSYVLAYQPAEYGEYGSNYGLYIYPSGPHQSQVYLVRKTRFPTQGSARDVSEKILAELERMTDKVTVKSL
jgi:hypothetical protein